MGSIPTRKEFFWSATPCASPPPCPSIFPDYSFLVHHPVKRDYILASPCTCNEWPIYDFTVTWQFSQKRTIGLFVNDQIPGPKMLF
jgi:hypothetical protein